VVSFEQRIVSLKETTMNREFSPQECWGSIKRCVINGLGGPALSGTAVSSAAAIRGEQ